MKLSIANLKKKFMTEAEPTTLAGYLRQVCDLRHRQTDLSGPLPAVAMLKRGRLIPFDGGPRLTARAFQAEETLTTSKLGGPPSVPLASRESRHCTPQLPRRAVDKSSPSSEGLDPAAQVGASQCSLRS